MGRLPTETRGIANLTNRAVSFLFAPIQFGGVEVMAKICQVSGKKGNTTAKFIRNRHSQGWKFKAPHKNRIQHANLQSVRVQVPGGNSVKLMIATSVLKSPEFARVVCGLKPIPKAWLKKASYNV